MPAFRPNRDSVRVPAAIRRPPHRAFLAAQGRSKAAMPASVIRLQSNCLLEFLHRFGKIPLGSQKLPEVVAGFRVVWLEPDRKPVLVHRLASLTADRQGVGQIEMSLARTAAERGQPRGTTRSPRPAFLARPARAPSSDTPRRNSARAATSFDTRRSPRQHVPVWTRSGRGCNAVADCRDAFRQCLARSRIPIDRRDCERQSPRRARRRQGMPRRRERPAQGAAWRVPLLAKAQAVSARGASLRPSPSSATPVMMRAYPPITAKLTSAASGKYIRCSKAASRIGTNVDVGASIKKNAAPKNPHAGRLTNAQPVRAKRANRQRRRNDLRRRFRRHEIVGKAECIRPNRKSQVSDEHPRLRQQICRGRESLDAKSGRICMETRRNQHPRQHQPCAGQRKIQPPMFGQRPSKRSRQERTIVEQQDHRRGDHHLLRRHAQEAGREACQIP